MIYRKVFSALILVALVATVSAQPVQLADTDSTDLDLELDAGETREFSISVETNPGFNDNFAVETRLRVSNTELEVAEDQDRVSGEEFDLERSLNSGGFEECRTFPGGKNYAKYICSFDSSDFGDENTVDYTLSSSPRLMPGDYQFELSLLSSPSSAPAIDNQNVNLSRGESSSVALESSQGSITVGINSGVNGSAEVESHESVAAETPQGEDEFVSAVSVNINSTEEDTSDGEIRFEHDEDLNDVDVYLLENGEWTSDDIEVVENGDDFVVAEVPHFSTYAAYGEEEETGGGGGGSTDFSPQPDQESDETQNDTQTSEDENQTDQPEGSDNQTGTGSEDTGENQTDEQTGQQPDGPGDTPGQANGLTGQFIQSPGAAGLGIVVLLALIVLGLDHTGRIDVRERFNELKNSFSQDEEEISFN
jgi:hypothetical protein